MNKFLKWILITIFVLAGIAGASYGAYKLYNYIVEDATAKIREGAKQGVKEGVEEGIDEGVGKGVGKALNPLNWIFGGLK